MRDLSKKTFQVSLSAMLTVLTLIALYLAALLPAGRLTLYFISGIFIAPLLYERKPMAAFLVYVCSALLSLLLMPGLVLSLPYILLFGHYGIGKYLIEENCRRKSAMLYKLLYYMACMVAFYFVCFGTVAGPWLAELAWPWLAVGAVAVFFVYDYCYSRVVVLYQRYIRRALMGN